MKGFNPDQLVARGVFDSLAELDAVMCELDEVLSAPRVSRIGWARGMDFNRAWMGSGVAVAAGTGATAVTVPPAGKPAALCVFCAWERAMRPGPRMAPPRFNGDVRLEPCARHAARPVISNQQAAGASDASPFPLPAA